MKSAFEWLAAGTALESVVREHERQSPECDRGLDPWDWLSRLMEKSGELAKTVNESSEGSDARRRVAIADIRRAAVQVAAVAVGMVEAMDFHLANKRELAALQEMKRLNGRH